MMGEVPLSQRLEDVHVAREHETCQELGDGWVMIGPVPDGRISLIWSVLHESGSFAASLVLDVAMPVGMRTRHLAEWVRDVQAQGERALMPRR